MKSFATIGCLFGTIFHLHSQGYIVPNGVTYGGGSPGFGSVINVISSPSNGDYTGFFLYDRVGDTFQFDIYADEGVRVFFVSLNDPISLQPIMSQSYQELSFPNTHFFEEGSPFYVGLYTGNDVPVNGIYNNPLFGWAHLVNNGGIVELLDGALEYGGIGIYAGTQTIIPEPSALTLAALGTLLLGYCLRRSSSQIEQT